MKIIIVGAGIAGLSLAIALGQSKHDVTILDAAAALEELGAGVQMTPQAVRYFFQWGLKDDVISQSYTPKEMIIKDWEDGSVLSAVPTGKMAEEYGAPYILIHRGNLLTILHQHALKVGAKLRLSSRVANYVFEEGIVELENGEKLHADLVIAADGINSMARKKLLGTSDEGSRPTGWAAVRMMTELSKLKQDPDTAPLINTTTPSSYLWIAPNVSCMIYQIRNHDKLNIVLSHRDDVNMSGFTLEQYQSAVNTWFKDFDAPVQKLISLALPKMQNFPVYEVSPPSSWAHSSGRFVLMGDATHAMAFYLSMGVSLAVEDAASLAEALDLACPALKDTSDAQVDEVKLKRAIGAFETVRKARARVVQEASLHAGNMAHIEDPQKRSRLYELLRTDGADETIPFEPATITQREGYGLADRKVRDWCYNYDVQGETRKAYESY